MRRRDLLGTAGAVLVSGAIAGHRAAAQDKKVLKASDVHPEGYPTVQAVENMGKKLEAATGGRLSDPDVRLDAVGRREGGDRAGAGRRDRSSPGSASGRSGPVVDDLNVFNLPFLFRDTAHMRKVDRRRRSARSCSTR